MTSAKPKPPLIPGQSRAYPVLPLRDIVVFPHMIVPLFVGREKSIKALEEVMRSDTFILLATQKNASDDDPATGAIYETGTLASELQLLKVPYGTVKVLVERAARARVTQYPDGTEDSEAAARVLADSQRVEAEAQAPLRAVVEEGQISVLQVEERSRSRVTPQMEKPHREHYLHGQMKAIQKELGDEEGKAEFPEIEEKIKRTKLSQEAREKATHELKKLRQ